jgi:hypothetical protein
MFTRWAKSASRIEGVIDEGRPPRRAGLVVLPKLRFMALTAFLLQLALAAICRFVRPPFSVMHRMLACVEIGSFGAICGWRAVQQGALVVL